jgi:hypothetical protein
MTGLILSDSDPAAAAGRATVEARVQRGEMVRPSGLGVPLGYAARYDHGGATDFGKSKTLLCPHFMADGRCGIWRYRNHVCTTWYCKHVRGAVGLRFWKALEQLLACIERTLACWCLLDQGFGSAAFDAARPERAPTGNLAGTLDPAAYRAMWGPWAGREQEFYRSCAQQVDALEWPDVLRIAGPDVAAHARLTWTAFDALHNRETPHRLMVGPFKVIGIDPAATGAGAQVEGYHGSDPLRLSRDLMDVLPCFDGRPVAEVLESIKKDKGVRIAPDLIRKLADFEILVSPENQSAPPAHHSTAARP